MEFQQKCNSLLQGYAPARVIMTAFELGVFTVIAEGNNTAEEIARTTRTSQRGMCRLLNALASLDVLEKRNNLYFLVPGSEAMLVKTSPEYMGSMWETDYLWSVWSHLTEVVRSDQPHVQLEKETNVDRFFTMLIRSLHVMNLAPARKLADLLLPAQIPTNSSILDIACGSGVWGIPFAEAAPEIHLDLLDFPNILAIAETYVRRHQVEKQVSYICGDLKRLDLGTDRYHLIILGNIVHSEGSRSSRDLIQRCGVSLRPGGKLAIIDFFPNEERTGPPQAILFALNMLLNTSEGDVFSVSEYNSWLRDAGLTEGSLLELDERSTVLLATKC
jgi:ubiquinone/menaquinone biosynthesis C-methylase UbiE